MSDGEPDGELDGELDPYHGHSPLTFALLHYDAEALGELLKNPELDVNIPDALGYTPKYLLRGGQPNSRVVAGMYLRDPRVVISTDHVTEKTPLMDSIVRDDYYVVLTMISVDKGIGPYPWHAIEYAHTMWRYEIIEILEKYQLNPGEARYKAREILKDPVFLAANLFASVVMLCDGYYRIGGLPTQPRSRQQRQRQIAERKAKKFFVISRRLPMELQMIIANRVYGVTKRDTVSVDDTNAALQRLALANN